MGGQRCMFAHSSNELELRRRARQEPKFVRFTTANKAHLAKVISERPTSEESRARFTHLLLYFYGRSGQEWVHIDENTGTLKDESGVDIACEVLLEDPRTEEELNNIDDDDDLLAVPTPCRGYADRESDSAQPRVAENLSDWRSVAPGVIEPSAVSPGSECVAE